MSMSSQLKDTKTDTQNLIELTKRLQLERYISQNSQYLFSKKKIKHYFINMFVFRKSVSNQQLLANAYVKTFQLSSSEVACLRSNNVTPEFFTALRKTQNISNNCKVLMQAGYQTSALSLMEQISTYQVIFILE